MTTLSWDRDGGQYPHMRTKGVRGGRGQIIAVTCSACGRVTDIPWCPFDRVERNLWQRGFSNPGNAKTIICPACAEQRKGAAAVKRKDDEKDKRELTPGQKRAAFCRIKAKEGPTTMTPTTNVQPLKAVAPRQATTEDRRRILDALEEHYDVGRKCYRGKTDDAVLADLLKVPRAWVAEVRDLVFGPNVNEVRVDAPKRIDELSAQYDVLAKDLMTQAERFMAAADLCDKALVELAALKAGLAA